MRTAGAPAYTPAVGRSLVTTEPAATTTSLPIGNSLKHSYSSSQPGAATNLHGLCPFALFLKRHPGICKLVSMTSRQNRDIGAKHYPVSECDIPMSVTYARWATRTDPTAWIEGALLAAVRRRQWRVFVGALQLDIPWGASQSAERRTLIRSSNDGLPNSAS